MFDSTIGSLILAAGKGTRMHSENPKVLLKLLEEPMLDYVYSALQPLFDRRIHTVVGHGSEIVHAHFKADIAMTDRFILQAEQLGTGHALQTAMPALQDSGYGSLVVVNGDTPLIRPSHIRTFVEQCLTSSLDLGFITLKPSDPASFGRVIRDDSGRACAVIEAKDYNPSVHGPEPDEINAGIYFFKIAAVSPLLSSLDNDNKNNEYYITDLIAAAVAAGLHVDGILVDSDITSLLGINTPAELIRSEDVLRRSIVEHHLESGVLIRSPESVRIGPKVLIDPGVEITGPTEIYGSTEIRKGTAVRSHCWIKDSYFDHNCLVHPFSHVEGAMVGPECFVGPYARLRPGAEMEEASRVGNFVEMKKARLGRNSKASHLTYLGDAEIGADTNIGAGTITCNYDGKNKHKTTIGDSCFIGSNTAMVAPVTLGKGVLIGAGSTITKDVPDEHLGIGRAKQRNIPRRG